MRVAIIGATGVLGRAVLPRLIERGHEARALSRSTGVDILDAPTLAPALAGCEAVMHLATAIPNPRSANTWALNDRVRHEGTRNLLAAARAVGVVRYVQQSVAHIYGDCGDEWIDESHPIQPSTVLESAAEMEALVQASQLEWTILRGGLFWGPRTDRVPAWLDAARRGELCIPDDGNGFVSLVHVEDMADACVRAVEAGGDALIANIVDDEPVRYATLFQFIAALVGGPQPAYGGPPALPSTRASNALAERALGWTPAHRSYRGIAHA